jgi:alpha-galactosidase
VDYRTHVSMWAMVASPMLIGSDVRTLSAYELEALVNPEIVGVSQDSLGQAAQIVGVGIQVTDTLQVYARSMADGSYAVA